jgi:hypothetical protein
VFTSACNPVNIPLYEERFKSEVFM